MQFKKSKYRSADAVCDRVAGQIEKALSEMGFDVWRESSRVSASEYVYVTIEGAGGEFDGIVFDDQIKIRVSDHINQASPEDFEVACDERALADLVGDHWTYPVIAVAEQTGREVPSRVRRLAEKKNSVAAAVARAEQEAAITRFLATRRMGSGTVPVLI